MSPKVSVIIPVYKSEKYIEKCVRSLFGQTLDSIEYIFIDDCTPDRSFKILREVLNDYPNRQPQVNIIKNEQNLGVGQTRQKGINCATGDFIIHCDPDDWVDSNLYKNMWEYAVETESDIVICDFIYEWETEKKIIRQNCPKEKADIFSAIAYGKLHCGFCNKLINSSLAKRYRIEPGINMWEDVSVIPLIVFNATTISHISNSYYHYRINESSLVHSKDLSIVESQIRCVNSLTKSLTEDNSIGAICKNDLNFLSWFAIEPLIESTDISRYKLWNTLFTNETDNFTHFSMSFLRRLRTFLVKKRYYITLCFVNSLFGKYISLKSRAKRVLYKCI